MAPALLLVPLAAAAGAASGAAAHLGASEHAPPAAEAGWGQGCGLAAVRCPLPSQQRCWLWKQRRRPHASQAGSSHGSASGTNSSALPPFAAECARCCAVCLQRKRQTGSGSEDASAGVLAADSGTSGDGSAAHSSGRCRDCEVPDDLTLNPTPGLGLRCHACRAKYAMGSRGPTFLAAQLRLAAGCAAGEQIDKPREEEELACPPDAGCTATQLAVLITVASPEG